MSNLLQRDAVVGPNGSIEVRVPELSPGQRVRVTIDPDVRATGGHAIDMLSSPGGQRLFKAASEVDAYLRAEREAWDR